LIILSNSSKRQDHSIRMLKKLGFDPNDFEQIITSGEVTYQMLRFASSSSSSSVDDTNGPSDKQWNFVTDLVTTNINDDQDQSPAKKVFVLGSGDGDEEYCNSCGWTLSTLDEASLILARGTFTINYGSGSVVDKRKSADRYQEHLSECLDQAARQRKPMLIANPDKIRPDEERPPMPGHIGDLYEVALQREGVDPMDAEALVRRIGKPFPEVYELALSANKDTDLSRVCMVGDALETDIAGAAEAGIASVWVLETGIHGPDLIVNHANGDESSQQPSLFEAAKSVLAQFNSEQSATSYAKGRQLSPTFVIPTFCW